MQTAQYKYNQHTAMAVQIQTLDMYNNCHGKHGQNQHWRFYYKSHSAVL